jgi:hypothetical protein
VTSPTQARVGSTGRRTGVSIYVEVEAACHQLLFSLMATDGFYPGRVVVENSACLVCLF